MKTMVAVVCAVAVCVPVMAQAPEASGRWEATFYTEGGTTPATMVLKKDGEKVTGTISSHLGEAPSPARRRAVSCCCPSPPTLATDLSPSP